MCWINVWMNKWSINRWVNKQCTCTVWEGHTGNTSLINKEVPVGMDNWEASLKERRLGKQSWNHRGGWNLQISSTFLPFWLNARGNPPLPIASKYDLWNKAPNLLAWYIKLNNLAIAWAVHPNYHLQSQKMTCQFPNQSIFFFSFLCTLPRMSLFWIPTSTPPSLTNFSLGPREILRLP